MYFMKLAKFIKQGHVSRPNVYTHLDEEQRRLAANFGMKTLSKVTITVQITQDVWTDGICISSINTAQSDSGM